MTEQSEAELNLGTYVCETPVKGCAAWALEQTLYNYLGIDLSLASVPKTMYRYGGSGKRM